MVKHLIGLIVTTIILTFLMFSGSCTNPLVPVIQHKYPECQLLDYETLDDGYLEAKLQCGPIIKIIKMKERR